MNILIKKMETDDEKRGKGHVHCRSWHEAYQGIVSDAYLEKMTEDMCVEMSFKWPENTFVAVGDGKVIGFSCFFRHDDHPEIGEVSAIYVLQEYYGTGVSQRLMEKALVEIADCPIIEVRVLKENGRAIRFYEKYGFRATGEEGYLESLKATAIRMVKS